MRVEQTKNNRPDKNEPSNFKTEKSLFDSSTKAQTASAANTPKPGAFEKILTEAREQTAKDDKSAGSKSDVSESASKTSDAEEKKEAARREEEKVKSEERNKKDGGEGQQGNDDENSAVYAQSILSPNAVSTAEFSAPAARSILHIADLERIVSFVRTQNIGDAQQILIALKNSVLDGLQVRLTSDQNGNIKAEFLTLNEKIRKQLKKREGELLEILKQRSNKFSEIEILLA